ncbi:MAG: hypothetical protein ABI307_12100 [Mycobacterium sp.]
MRTLATQGVLLVAGVELLAVLLHQRQLVAWAAGIVTAFLLLGIRRMFSEFDDGLAGDQEMPDEPGESLLRWRSSTESRIRWSESTRTDWDRHWRPILARNFEISTGQRRAKDSAAFHATGRALFGTDLWQWVDPGNVAPTEDPERGPGRAALEEILQRLEQR